MRNATLAVAITVATLTALPSPAQAGDERPCFSWGEFHHIAGSAVEGSAWTKSRVEEHVETTGRHRPVVDTEYRIAYVYEGCDRRGRGMQMRVSYARDSKEVRAMVWKVVSGPGFGSSIERRVGIP